MRKASTYRTARRLEYKKVAKGIKGPFQPWNQAEVTETVEHPRVRANRSRKWDK